MVITIDSESQPPSPETSSCTLSQEGLPFHTGCGGGGVVGEIIIFVLNI